MNFQNLSWRFGAVLTIFLPLFAATELSAQPLGTSKAPAEMLRTTILIETMQTNTAKRFVHIPDLLAVIQNQNGQLVQLSNTNNIFAQVDVVETNYSAIGSGCLLFYSNMFFIVTAGHVVNATEDVYFRVPKTGTNAANPNHYSHLIDRQKTGLGWIRSTNADLAVTTISLNQQTDHVTVHGLIELSATYDQVSLGDDVFVIGYPGLVEDINNPEVHIIRNGMIASKLGNDMLLVDAFAFPGNSGGPVFWKPSAGLKFGGGLAGTEFDGRPASFVGIVIAYKSYKDVAVSQQTKQPRVLFEENSGLCQVVSASKVLELFKYPAIQNYIKKLRTN